MIIEFMTFMKECQFDICFQFVWVIFLFQKQTPGGCDDAFGEKELPFKSNSGQLRRKVPVTTLKTRRKNTAKNCGLVPTAKKADERTRKQSLMKEIL